MSGRNSGSTVSTSYIFLKPRSRSKDDTKKAILTPTVKGLFRVANRLFKSYGEVKAIYTEDGQLVTDIQQIIPGDTYYVTNVEPDMRSITDANSNKPKPAIKNKQSNQKVPSAFHRLFGTDTAFSPEMRAAVEERRRQEEEERKRQEEEERRRQEEEERRRKEEEEARKRREEERKRLEQESKRHGQDKRGRRLEDDDDDNVSNKYDDGSEFYDEDEDEDAQESKGVRRFASDEDLDGDDDNAQAFGRRNREKYEALKRHREEMIKRGMVGENVLEDESEGTSNAANSDYDSYESGSPEVTRKAPKRLIAKEELDVKEEEEEEDADDSFAAAEREAASIAAKEQFMQEEDVSEISLSESTDHSSPGQRESAREEEETAAEHRKTSIDDVLAELLGENVLRKKIDAALPLFKAHAQKFLSDAPNLEILQEENWYRGLFSAIRDQFSLNYDSIKMEELLSMHARDLIARHRLPVHGNAVYALKAGIVGPRHSGKSTFLTVLAGELMADLVTNGAWKRTFIFYANLQTVHSYMQSIAGVYNTICDLTLDALSVQRPLLTRHITTLKKFFVQVLENKKAPPRFTQNCKLATEHPQLAQTLNRIAARVFEKYRDEEGLGQFMTTVFMLPQMIASAVGFTKMFFILDSFDSAAYKVDVEAPFSVDSNIKVDVVEYWKFALQNANYVIACEDQQAFFDACMIQSEGGTDISAGMTLVSTLGMIDEFDDDVAIKLDIEGQARAFVLTRQHCGGCAAFVSLWLDLNDAFDAFEGIGDDDENEIEKEEARLELISQAQQVLDELFKQPNAMEADAILVIGARRDPKSEQ